MQMKVFRCKICGDAYIGEKPPTHCPFCGAPSRYMILASEWKEGQDQVKELSKPSRENLEKALGLELSNTGFYQAASKASQDREIFAMFSRLSKVELEHAKTISKIASRRRETSLRTIQRETQMINPPEWQVKEEPAKSDLENIQSALQREEKATKFYAQALAQATEPRVREVFQGLIEVESTHTNLLQNVGSDKKF